MSLAAPAGAPRPRLRGRDLARAALRTPLLQAAWNYERHQGVGWACCLVPVLGRLYPDPRERSGRLAEHLGYFNTQPTLASFALGAVASLEEVRAGGGDGALGGEEIGRVKTALGSALAALGDTLFWSTLRPFAAATAVVAAHDFGAWGALVLLLVYNAFHLTLRVRGVWAGYRLGPGVLSSGVRSGLQRAAGRLAALGAATCGLLAAVQLSARGGGTLAVQAAFAAGIVAGLLTAIRPRPSATHWALAAGAACGLLAWR